MCVKMFIAIIILLLVQTGQAEEVVYEQLWSYEAGSGINEISVSSDYSYMAAGSQDAKVYFFNRDGELLWSYETDGGVQDVSVSSDGSYIAAGSMYCKLYYFNKDGKLLWSYEATDGSVNSVSVSSDGSYIAAESLRKVYLFNRDGELLWSYETDGGVRDVSVSSDGSYIAAGSLDDKIYLFNKYGKRSYKTDGGVWDVSVSPDGSYIAAGSQDAKVYLFNRDGELLWSYKTDSSIFSVSASFDGSYIAAGSNDDKIYLFNKDGELLWNYEIDGGVWDVFVSSDGSYMAAGYRDCKIYLFNRYGELLWSYETDGGVRDVFISSDGSYIAAGSFDKKVYFFVNSENAFGTGDNTKASELAETSTTPEQATSTQPTYLFLAAAAIILIALVFVVTFRKKKRPESTVTESVPPEPEPERTQPILPSELIPSLTIPASQFTALRTVWDPSNKDFVWGAGKPDEYGELPRIKRWIEGNNPNIYWFLLKIMNLVDHPVTEWNVTLYTEQALTITEAHIDEKQVRIVKSDFDTDNNRNVCVVAIPPELGVSIPANGGRRSMYFKMDIRCEDALKMEFGVYGVVKLGTTPQVEVPIRDKRFTYACKFGDFENMFRGSPDTLASQVMENLQNTDNREILQNFTNSFKLIRDFEKYCNDRYAESKILIEKLEVVHSSLKAAEPITKDEVLPLVEDNLNALQIMSSVEEQKERGIRMCEKLVELLHIATSNIRYNKIDIEG
jgi:WD40 repeat protein